jgi:hypothetical protein
VYQEPAAPRETPSPPSLSESFRLWNTATQFAGVSAKRLLALLAVPYPEAFIAVAMSHIGR